MSAFVGARGYAAAAATATSDAGRKRPGVAPIRRHVMLKVSRAASTPMTRFDPPTSPDGLGVRRIGKESSRYLMQAPLASGGMGSVYRVLDVSTGETRALKRMNADAARKPLLVEAFEREYRVLASLDHPRIIRVFDYGVDDVGPYYTMELLEGADMRQSAPLGYREACGYLCDIATSLALLHSRRLIHRDLSATNVRKTADGHCKLLDFGALASFGTAPMIVGTPPAIPPEALAEAALDQRADLYALGALAYWMLARHHAYPARRIRELPDLWAAGLAPPSAYAPGVPRELDELVLSLLSADPLARPASAAEVISRLRVIGNLPEEDSTEIERLAQSFLLSPHFTARGPQLEELERHIAETVRGQGAALRIEAISGMGRSRLLGEVGVRAQVQGAAVVSVDASTHRQMFGTIHAMVGRVFDAFPGLARNHAAAFHGPLSALGREIEGRLPPRTSRPSSADRGSSEEARGSVEDWIIALAREKPLVLLVDNVEYADAASLGVLASLAGAASGCPLLLIVTERQRRDDKVALGVAALRSRATSIVLPAFQRNETLELVRSIFGDAPNVARFSDWLHTRTAGSPLHTIEITRQLVARRVVQYTGGVWTLPADRPDTVLPAALGDALSLRIESLSPEARSLAECLSLQRREPTLALCRLLTGSQKERDVLHQLDELAASDVLHADEGGSYRFSSTALRETLLGGMDRARKESNHRRLGEAFTVLAGDDDKLLRIEAGWHLIRGADEMRGANLIASVTFDAVSARTFIADLHHVAEPLEAALVVYKRHRRSKYERMPLLAALAHAGYYEDRVWGERYGDDALDAIEDIAGLGTARRLRPFLGKALSLVIGLVWAIVCFYTVPRRFRPYSFHKVMVQLFGAVTTLTGAASLSLDVERARHVANVLEPFSFLPKRLTPVGIYEFCRGLEQIGQEYEADAYSTFETLLLRFNDPRYYPTLPADARKLYVAGVHFARGAFAIFRADSRPALESADALDRSGMKLYSMIGSQLRFLYYMNRGEFELAAPHRDKVELHAAHVGSAWQVETWEAPALILIHSTLADIVAFTRIANRIELMSQRVPSLRLYARLAPEALRVVRNDSILDARDAVLAILRECPPRSFIGWAAVYGYLARGCNDGAREQLVPGMDAREWFEEARMHADTVLSRMTDGDREYTSMFLIADIERARADAALGRTSEALSHLDRLLERFRDTDHPLVHGLLHEARARIAWEAGMHDDYAASTAEVERWFRPTGTPSLIAKCERLIELSTRSFHEFPAAQASRIRNLAPAGPELQSATVLQVPDAAAPATEATEHVRDA